jgi:DNA-binding CsgD family transcriptional regulator
VRRGRARRRRRDRHPERARPTAQSIASCAGHHSLAGRQTQVLDRLLDGLTIRAIALDLDIGEETVRGYLPGAYRKLGVRTRGEAVAAHLARRAEERTR